MAITSESTGSHDGQDVRLNAYLSVSDAAKRLGVSPSTIREYTKRGLLPDRRNPFNKYRLYRQADVAALIKRITRAEREAEL